jgi:glycosyltransferase involved in cell wall biosynthesis
MNIRRALFVIPEYPPHAGGGIITFYRNFVPHLAAAGVRVRVLVAGASSEEFPPYDRDGVSVEAVSLERIALMERSFGTFDATPLLRRHLATSWAAWEQAGRGEGFDVVETTDFGLLFAPWVVNRGVPSVVQLHGSLGQISLREPHRGEELQSTLFRLIEQTLLPYADELQTYSEANAHFWSDLTRRSVQVLRPGLAVPETGTAERDAHGLVVGRVQVWKGPQVLCEALARMADPPVIDWVGRDTRDPETKKPFSSSLKSRFPEVWEKQVHWLGSRSPQEAGELQRRARFAVIPSTWDVFNFTVAESMAASTPVVCSNGAGAAEVVTSGIEGDVFESENAESLAVALSRMVSRTDAEIRAMGDAARQKIARLLDPSAMSAHRLEGYRAVTRHDEAPPSWVVEAVSPNASGGAGLTFLDAQPLRELVRYTARRTLRKVKRRG